MLKGYRTYIFLALGLIPQIIGIAIADFPALDLKYHNLLHFATALCLAGAAYYRSQAHKS